MKRGLTPKTIDALPPAVNKRYEVYDQLLPGLHLRMSAKGAKVFYVSKPIRYRDAGPVARRMTIPPKHRCCEAIKGERSG